MSTVAKQGPGAASHAGGSPPNREPAPTLPGTPARRLWVDRLGHLSVVSGGMAIITAILGILVFILLEVWPLTGGARVTPGPPLAVDSGSPLAIGEDEYREKAVLLDSSGRVLLVDLETRALIEERVLPLGQDDELSEPVVATPSFFAAADRAGRVLLVPYAFDVVFDGAVRRVTPRVGELESFELGAAPRALALRGEPGGSLTLAAALDEELLILRREATENFLTGETELSEVRSEWALEQRVSFLTLDEGQRRLFGATDDGRLLLWQLDEGPQQPSVFGEPGSRVSALGLLFGDGALAVGRQDGSIEIWFRLSGSEGPRLERVRTFEGGGEPVIALAASRRGKGFLAVDRGGNAGLFHSTSHRTLWQERLEIEAPLTAALSPKANGALIASGGSLLPLEIDNPHPEVGLGTLFGRVWYEGYPEPEYVWQSTGGSDDFEPKLSLVPLLIGTLKGTFYSLVLAIPLGVLGAMYTSQFLHPSMRRVIKPVVEIMAALPSVVLGFLAGLWLAPRLESSLMALLLGLFAFPLVLVATGLLWARLPRAVRNSLPPGSEVLAFGVVIVAAGALCGLVSGPLEALLFGGPLSHWLTDALGVGYDQRNALVVGLAMGFAVIPIIFSVSEDAFSNVPRTLTSGSLALGATPWQTVTQVVLPTASPGIFSAIMIGFGRAVGETMIVLMATGNTPIMNWSPFNGFRTLSANIAVEIPEAPFGGTLYRTLFLSALLLFLLTFAVNSVAELVRARLRRRYANL